MALETGTYISDLVSTNPTSGDPVSQADDHMRLIKGTTLATFPNVTGPVTATHTQLNAVLTNGTAVASTSGTSIDFTSIPSWVQCIKISFAGVSTTGGSNLLVQIGDSGGIETSGYLGAATAGSSGSSPVVTNPTNGFEIAASSAANAIHGQIILTLISASAFTWAAVGNFGLSNTTGFMMCTGSKSTSATLDRVRITTVSGSPTFDAGVINIQYE